MPVPVLVETLASTDSAAAIAVMKTLVVTGNLDVPSSDPTPKESCTTPSCEEGIIKLLSAQVEAVSNWLDSVLTSLGEQTQEQISLALSMFSSKDHRNVRGRYVFSTYEDSQVNNSMRRTFLFAFSIFHIQGTIDLYSHTLTSGILTVVVPVFGPLRLTTTIAGSLDDHSIKVELPSTANMSGSFTLSLDPKHENLLIDYTIRVTFAGLYQDSGVKVVPLQVPHGHAMSHTAPPRPRFVNPSEKVNKDSAVLAISFADLTKHADLIYQNSLFDNFIANHYNEHGHIIVTQQGGKDTTAAQGYNFFVSFLDVFELQGHLNPTTRDIVATLFLVVPVWGRVSVTGISGSLENHLSANFNLTRQRISCCNPQNNNLARGSITLFLEDQILKAAVNTSVRFAGQINQTLSLVTLPS